MLIMEQITAALKKKKFSGDIDGSPETRDFYSHDASLFEIMPQLILFPKDSNDVQIIISVVNEFKKDIPSISVTARSAGTDMSGGAINDSIIIDFNKYFSHIEDITSDSARTQPGVFYRDFEKKTLQKGALLPSFPASRELCTVGGMVNNNSGGELSLRYGKTENYVAELNVILSDGKPYKIRPLSREELKHKKSLQTFEGELYRKMYALIDANYDKIKAAKPHVTKNSTGYNLWDVWDRETGVFDLTKLFVGAQGTLGFVTDIKFRLVRQDPYSGVLVAFMKNIDPLGQLINSVLAHKPTSFESFDNYTLWFSIKFMPYFRKTIGWGGLIKLAFSLIPDGLILLRGIPKMILLIEFTGQTQQEVDEKILSMQADLKKNYKIEATEDDDTPKKAWKFRIMRRESFNILRKKVKDKHTAPFIDDLVVPPPHLVEFLPKLRKIINKYHLVATVAGHVGDGNFHVIPLMKIEEMSERAKIEPVMKEVNELVLHYGGSLSGEHNDGLVRGPWLSEMYGEHIVDIFRKTKIIFDPHEIFNPHKKANASWKYSMDHVREHF
jgi:FAD/FMN-containing dehydrogenase